MLLGWSVLAPIVPVAIWMPSLVVLMGTHAAMQRGALHGVVVILVLGLLAGLLSGGPRGLYLLSLAPVVPIARFARTRLQAESTLLQAATIIPTALLCELLFALGILLFRSDLPMLAIYLRVVPGSALLTGLMAIPVVALLRRSMPDGPRSSVLNPLRGT
ncbi:MAG: hypothetical protein EA398_01440 [Deltaproteobacteria bacterium]|nr:MAG: hypothetical protein EA398_01440 [Deltaproteobacteria bacterium]